MQPLGIASSGGNPSVLLLVVGTVARGQSSLQLLVPSLTTGKEWLVQAWVQIPPSWEGRVLKRDRESLGKS